MNTLPSGGMTEHGPRSSHSSGGASGVQEGREPTPRAACIDSQSVKTTEVGGQERGSDGGKKINGRKRPVRVDTIGVLLVVLIMRAALDDGAAVIKLLAHLSVEEFPRLSVIFGDSK